jgi:hypothetical protein
MIQNKWTKSTQSGGQGDCVEVFDATTVIHVRDSKNPEGGILSFDRDAFVAFLNAVRDGRFDLAD